MGHALNNSLQDVLIRFYRMKGYETLWQPGTDHAGIATQAVVEKNLEKEGIKKNDLGREKFIAKVWEWKESSGGIIIEQLKKLGCSCDWTRSRFTMDKDLLYFLGRVSFSYSTNNNPSDKLSDVSTPSANLLPNSLFKIILSTTIEISCFVFLFKSGKSSML